MEKQETIQVSAEVASMIKEVGLALGCSTDELLRQAVTFFKNIRSGKRVFELLQGSGEALRQYRESDPDMEKGIREAIEYELSGPDPLEGHKISSSQKAATKRLDPLNG